MILERLRILPGRDRSGAPEDFDAIELLPGDGICLVGPTGSGKSRLLADIEWSAAGDTPSGRSVLWNGEVLSRKERMRGPAGKVAQISQTMNFLMDLSVRDFLELHAQAHGLGATGGVEEAYTESQRLAGEGFAMETRLPALSGGQSRALMIADVAILGAAPVVLVDEIENAGVDRQAALALLHGKGRIVLLATHDPGLALSSPRRIVLANGGVRQILSRSPGEERMRGILGRMETRLDGLRARLRAGHAIA